MSGETEWEDALIKHGIIDKPQQIITADDIAEQVYLEHLEEDENETKLGHKTLNQLDELEDDYDEDTLTKYRRRRLEEMKAKAARNKFGQYIQISEPEFIPEVSKAEAGVFVILHLFNHSKTECKLLHQHLDVLAAKHKYAKFRKIVAQECIHNFPESQCPTILVYKDGDVVAQISGLSEFAGLRSTPECVEFALAKKGILESEIEVDPRIAAARMKLNRNVKNRKQQYVDNDSDDDFSDLSD